MSKGAEREPYTSALTPSVVDFIIAYVQRETTLEKIEACISLLEEFPAIGRIYDPEYPVARTPFPCRSFTVPDTPFTLYYLKEDDVRRIVIFAIEWTAGNPAARFCNAESKSH